MSRGLWLLALAGCHVVFGTPPPVDSATDAVADAIDSADKCAGLTDLRFCMTFSDPLDDEQATDGGPFGYDAVLEGVEPAMRRDGEPAASIHGASEIRVGGATMLDLPGPLTFAMWIYVTPGANPDTVAALDNHAQYAIVIIEALNRISCRISRAGDPGSIHATSNNLATGRWMHVACVRTSDTVDLYIDGARVESVAATGEVDQTGDIPMRIGQNADPSLGATDRLTGGVDDVYIFARDLAPAEIEMLRDR